MSDVSPFSHYYRGRHVSGDALWWLDHPEEVAPSGADPVGWLFERVCLELRDAGLEEAAKTMEVAARQVLEVDRTAAIVAMRRALRDAESWAARDVE